METEQKKQKCPYCGAPLKRDDKKKKGILLIVISLVFGVFFVASIVTILLWLQLFGLGIYWFFKKERFVYWCKECLSTYKETDIVPAANQSLKRDEETAGVSE